MPLNRITLSVLWVLVVSALPLSAENPEFGPGIYLSHDKTHSVVVADVVPPASTRVVDTIRTVCLVDMKKHVIVYGFTTTPRQTSVYWSQSDRCAIVDAPGGDDGIVLHLIFERDNHWADGTTNPFRKIEEAWYHTYSDPVLHPWRAAVVNADWHDKDSLTLVIEDGLGKHDVSISVKALITNSRERPGR